MRYKEIVKTDYSLRALICPNCGTATSGEEETCLKCGEILFNLCKNKHKNKANARFCSKCRELTLYYLKGYLKNWKDEIN